MSPQKWEPLLCMKLKMESGRKKREVQCLKRWMWLPKVAHRIQTGTEGGRRHLLHLEESLESLYYKISRLRKEEKSTCLSVEDRMIFSGRTWKKLTEGHYCCLENRGAHLAPARLPAPGPCPHLILHGFYYMIDCCWNYLGNSLFSYSLSTSLECKLHESSGFICLIALRFQIARAYTVPGTRCCQKCE